MDEGEKGQPNPAEPRPTGSKKAKVSPPSCCSCQEESLPYLVLVGCSNRHTICHVCARMLISSRIVMQKFPQSFPGKISDMSDLVCPLCREPVHGITNMFVDTTDLPALNDCPYAELLNCKCPQLSAPDLQQHIIKQHNQCVKCPNCLMWLGTVSCDDDRNMSSLLQFHIMKQCKKVKCHGCDRTGNMINMYMHSSIGREGGSLVCESAKDMFRLFGESLAESAFMFDEPEDLTFLSSTMMQWTLQYFYHRIKSSESSDKEFRKLCKAFFLTMFCTIHHGDSTEPIDRDIQDLVEVASSGKQGEYEERILLGVSVFAKHRGLNMDRVSTLPFFYRILVMSLADPDHAKGYPDDISTEEEAILAQLVHFYGKLIPANPRATWP